MNLRGFSSALVATAALVSTGFQPCVAQTAQSLNPQSAAPLAASASTVVPALVPFSGLINEPDGKAISGETAITFLIFKDQEGGAPLFAETQAVTPDASGHYKVQLGATLANGLPTDLFSTGEARWLEVQAAGQPPQPRVLMASVPYALKAADSATLGGLPASAFVLAGSKAAADFAAAGVSATTTTASNVTTTGGVSGYLPEFSGANTIADSPVFINGANVGIGTATPTANLDVNGTALISGALTANGGATIGGSLELAPTGKATATAGDNSQMLKFYTSAYNSTSSAVVNPRFEWQAAVTGNDTASPSATLNLLSSTTSAGATNTGFSFNANGTVTFAPGQTFPGTGNGTITAVTAGTGLTGGGTSGNVTLNLNTSNLALLNAGTNTFTGNLEVHGGALLDNGAFLGAPSGVFGSFFVASPAGVVTGPVLTIQGDDNAYARNAAQQLVIQGATESTQQLLIGYTTLGEGVLLGGYATIQSTSEGSLNTPIMLQPNGGCVCIATNNTWPYSNPLIVGQGQGNVVADGYTTYSSRRFKTNIQTLPEALDKVEKLRGVSYTLKATGKHEIGVIAEEVGKVVPEVVTYEKNGVDAQSVDYNRLTALLIEATKQQQAEIASQRAEAAIQQAELTKVLRQIKTAQAQIHRQAATISSLKAQVHDGAESLRQVRQQLAPRVSQLQPTLVASR